MGNKQGNCREGLRVEALTALVRLGRAAEERRKRAEENIARIDRQFEYGRQKDMSTEEYAACIRSRCANEHVSASASTQLHAYATAARAQGLCHYDEFLAMTGAIWAPERGRG